jgi:hypothetical protein
MNGVNWFSKHPSKDSVEILNLDAARQIIIEKAQKTVRIVFDQNHDRRLEGKDFDEFMAYFGGRLKNFVGGWKD